MMVDTTEQSSSKSSPPESESSDEQLLVRYRDEGDERAFDELVHRYEKPIYSYLRRYLHSASLAEDVFQTTCMRVHEKCRLFTEDRRVRPWLYSIATHQAIDVLRKEGRNHAVSLDEEHHVEDSDLRKLINLIESKIPSPLEQAAEHERARWARQAVRNLPDHMRVVILLIYFQGLKYSEAAKTLDLPVGTVKSRVHKALLALNKAWRHDHPISRGVNDA